MNESFCQYFHKSDDIDKYSCNSHCNSAHNWNIPVLAYFILPRTAQGTLAVGEGINGYPLTPSKCSEAAFLKICQKLSKKPPILRVS
jgi:hypothetical protein